VLGARDARVSGYCLMGLSDERKWFFR